MMVVLFVVVGVVIGFVVGSAVTFRTIMNNPDEFNNAIEYYYQEHGSSSIVEIYLEKVNNSFCAYEHGTNRFVAQGKTTDDLFERLQEMSTGKQYTLVEN